MISCNKYLQLARTLRKIKIKICRIASSGKGLRETSHLSFSMRLKKRGIAKTVITSNLYKRQIVTILLAFFLRFLFVNVVKKFGRDRTP